MEGTCSIPKALCQGKKLLKIFVFMCLLIKQSFKESAKACFINDVFNARRQCCPCIFQHLETASTLETLQDKILDHFPWQQKTHMIKKFPWPKITCPKISHDKTNCPKNPTVKTYMTKKFSKINAPPIFHHNQNLSHIHTQLPNFSITMQKNKNKFLHV